MTDRSTIARPYARASFAQARDAGRLQQWSDALRVGAAVVRDPRVAPLLGNPRVGSGELAQLVIDIADAKLDEVGESFVRTLAENRRLAYLPEISSIFDELKDEAEGVVDVTITSALPLDEAQRSTLARALEGRLKRQVRLHCELDAGLIGGAVLRAGDLVIDGSLRARLERIAYDLTA
jgi:F-type H+-transporting ATPase subunit delta